MGTTQQIRRFDRCEGGLQKATRRDNGWLRAPAYLTRVGVFTYMTADGRTRRELRLPEEVFASDSLESFALVPITDDHPTEPHGLDATNTARHTVGAVGQPYKADDGEHVEAVVQFTDAGVIAKVEAGKVELSCGYFCDLDETPGEWHGLKYDALQKNIRGNHVALVDKGRAGASCRVRLDSSDAEMILCESQQCAQTGETVKRTDEGPQMKIAISGVEFEVSEAIGQAFNATEKAHADALAALKVDADKVSARADAAERAKADADKAHADAADPKRFEAAVAARVALLAQAREVLGTEAKIDGDDMAIRVAVITKMDPDFKADGRSPDYITARYDAALQFRAKSGAPTSSRVDGTEGAPVSDKRAAFNAAVAQAHTAKK